jgi:hypothetical protein
LQLITVAVFLTLQFQIETMLQLEVFGHVYH